MNHFKVEPELGELPHKSFLHSSNEVDIVDERVAWFFN